MNERLELITTADGSKTLYLPGLNEQYHSVNGAFTESMHVFIRNGLMYLDSLKTANILEVGFGTGLNALLTAITVEKMRMKVRYLAIEKYPLTSDIIAQLNYGSHPGIQSDELFEMIHNVAWNKSNPVSQWFEIEKIEADVHSFNFQLDTGIDLVYFDAFGPDVQPEMWELDVFKRVYGVMAPYSVFVTYSAKGEVRRKLIESGFRVERLPGPPGKREMLRGIKNISG